MHLCKCICVSVSACYRVSRHGQHKMDTWSAKGDCKHSLIGQGRVGERERRGRRGNQSEYVLSLSATCATSLARSMEDVKFSAIIFMAHTRLTSPHLASSRHVSILHLAFNYSLCCSTLQHGHTCHCLLHNCRHLAGINYSSPRLTRCLIRKRM